MLVRHILCLLIVTCWVVSSVLSKEPSEAGGGPVLTDPQQRDAEQLLKDANESRSSNRLVEAAVLAYLALKAAEAEQGSAALLKARAHLFLSEMNGDLGYRAMERIHAKAAYRERERDVQASSNLEPGQFHSRLGVVAIHGGDFAVAEYHLRRALEAFEAAQQPNSPGIVSTHVDLARLVLQRANIRWALDQDGVAMLQSAQTHLDQALSLLSELPDDRELTLTIYQLQAEILSRLSGHLPTENQAFTKDILTKAEELFRNLLDIRRQDPSGLLRRQLPLINGLISVTRRMGRYVEATDYADEALKLTEQLQKGDVDIALNMALVSEHFENKELTLKLCNIVMNSEEARSREVSSMSSEALALAFSAQGRYRSMICLALLGRSATKDDNRARQMLDIVLRRKAIVTDAEGTFWKTLHSQSAADLKGARSKLVSLRNLLSTKVATGDSKDLWDLINVIESQEEVLSVEPQWRGFGSEPERAEERKIISGYGESILKGMSPWDAISAQEGELEDEKVDVEAVARGLPPNTVLVEFAKIDDFDLEREVFLGTARYWALILHPNGATKAFDLGDADRLESDITAALSVLRTGDRLLPEPQLQAMSKLYDVLWSPLASAIGEAESVVLSPDAALALVPFGALLAPDSRFIIEHHTLYQVVTGRKFGAEEEATDRIGTRPVIVADPDYDAARDPGSPAQGGPLAGGYSVVSKSLVRLQETLTEGEVVKGILGGGVDLLTRKDASERKIRSVLSPPILHLATHGLFLEKAAKPPTGNLNREDAVALDAAYVHHVRSLSQSGLALSGLNSGGMAADDDGLLTAFDVASMELSGTDLVVLSGCDTGLGDAVAGEGVMGLRRAFRIAGARYVVMSLWRLSDKEALRQMRMFYKAYKGGQNPVLALRDMQRARISRLREVLGQAPPALWGALTVQGI